MNISGFLKKINKTKVELAKELNVSRPTLNQYIESYENGQKIENERYEIIFNRLFSNEKINRIQFDRQMDSVKFLLERDRKYDIGNLKPEAADIVADIHNKLVYDMSIDNWNRKVYDAILILLNNYRTNTIMRELAGYFSDLNSVMDLTDLSIESKAYYAYFYKFLHAIVVKAPDLCEDEFELFLKRREEIINEKKHSREIITQNIQNRMQQVLEEVQQEYNINETDVSEDELLAEVIRRMKSGE